MCLVKPGLELSARVSQQCGLEAIIDHFKCPFQTLVHPYQKYLQGTHTNSLPLITGLGDFLK